MIKLLIVGVLAGIALYVQGAEAPCIVRPAIPASIHAVCQMDTHNLAGKGLIRFRCVDRGGNTYEMITGGKV